MRAHKLDLSCVRVDFDADGDVDVADFAEMQPSLIGGAYPAASPAYRYDCRNQMDSFTDGATGVRTAYLYDALGRRIGKIVDADGPSPQVTYFFYDGDRIVEERDGSGSTTATYVYGRYIDEVLTARRDADGNGTPEDYFFHADDLYNVLTVTDAAGQVVERYEYGAFGKPTIYAPDAVTVRPASAIGNNRLWNGREYDAETGLYYYRTRYLDPRIGRFTTRDTIGIWGDPMNLGNGYAYVGNNPWTHLDPVGLGPPFLHGYPTEADWRRASGADTYAQHRRVMADFEERMDAFRREHRYDWKYRPDRPKRPHTAWEHEMLGYVSPFLPVVGSATHAGFEGEAGNYGNAAFYGAWGFTEAGLMFAPGAGQFAGLGKPIDIAKLGPTDCARMAAAAKGAGRTNAQLVQDIAARADAWGARRGLGKGQVAGTLKHGYADTLLMRYQNRYGSRGLSTEVRYLNGVEWHAGMPLKGSIRLDVVEGPLNNPTWVWDYKFGSAQLTAARINQIRTGAGLGPTVPVDAVRP